MPDKAVFEVIICGASVEIFNQARVGFQKAREFQGRIRRQIRIETGTADWKCLHSWSRLIHKNRHNFSADRLRRLVMRYDQHLALEPLEAAWVIGGGRGNFNLNAYRCGILHGNAVFEKIYLRESEAWRRLGWFYSNIAPRLKERVRVPRLLHQVQGGHLAAAYFEYMPEVETITKDNNFDAIRTFQRQVSDIDMTGQPSWFTDFRLEPQYNEGATCLRRILCADGRDPSDVDAIEKSLLEPGNRKILAHGDLMPGNISADGVILDWDRCGAFPPGYDFSRIMGLTLHCNSLDDVESVTKEYAASGGKSARGSLDFFRGHRVRQEILPTPKGSR